MFKKILFATSVLPSCDHAARVAFDMAKRYSAELTVFHVPGIPTRGFSPYVVDVKTHEKVTYDEAYLRQVTQEIKDTYAELLKKCENYMIETLPGISHVGLIADLFAKDISPANEKKHNNIKK